MRGGGTGCEHGVSSDEVDICRRLWNKLEPTNGFGFGLGWCECEMVLVLDFLNCRVFEMLLAVRFSGVRPRRCVVLP